MPLALTSPDKRTWLVIVCSLLFVVTFIGFFWLRAKSLSDSCYAQTIANLPPETKEDEVELTHLERNLLEVYIADRIDQCVHQQHFFFFF